MKFYAVTILPDGNLRILRYVDSTKINALLSSGVSLLLSRQSKRANRVRKVARKHC